ncbi:hypothetical protein J5N97_011582 [Dioscorea zingiberensis]|uniref:Uncharacterized protein n=1 Tax=Dioscorea zingiberensis TaxID=325984 RepID=A0A9D5HPQ1_9LILI|nr:hypothetical protein J5N97_011582 [Dioscorea zingiberensis]
MLGSKVISLARPPPAFVHSQTLIRPTVISCVPDEKTADPAPDPPARKSPRGSSQLNRWSMARSIRAGRRLARPAQGKDSTATRTASPIQPSISAADEEEVDSGDDDGEMSTAKEIYMVSDGTGWTAEHSVNAALGQFEHCLVDRGCAVNTHLFSMVEDVNKLIEIIKQAAKEGALLLYTLADPSMAEAAKHGCQLWGVPATDILSPTTEAIAAHLGVAPSGIPREVTGKAIEETAAVVVSICHDRKKKCSMPSISKRY